jgi:hypothetical protein
MYLTIAQWSFITVAWFHLAREMSSVFTEEIKAKKLFKVTQDVLLAIESIAFIACGYTLMKVT